MVSVEIGPETYRAEVLRTHAEALYDIQDLQEEDVPEIKVPLASLIRRLDPAQVGDEFLSKSYRTKRIAAFACKDCGQEQFWEEGIWRCQQCELDDMLTSTNKNGPKP